MFLTELHSFLEACSSWQLLKLLGCLGAVLRSHRFPACASKLGRKVWISSVMPHTSCQALVRPQSIRQRVSDVYRALWLFVLCISPNTQTLKSLSREQFWMGRDAFAIFHVRHGFGSSRQQILPMLPCRISCPDSVSDRVPAT